MIWGAIIVLILAIANLVIALENRPAKAPLKVPERSSPK
jgi:hypothetical protein